MFGTSVTPDILYSEIEPADYDAVVFVGGGGAREYFDDSIAHNIAVKTLKAKKILGAICIAPSILANAGLLQNKKAVAFSSEKVNLQNKGALIQNVDVARDGNIITATGPQSAEKFGEAIVKAIKSV